MQGFEKHIFVELLPFYDISLVFLCKEDDELLEKLLNIEILYWSLYLYIVSSINAKWGRFTVHQLERLVTDCFCVIF